MEILEKKWSEGGELPLGPLSRGHIPPNPASGLAIKRPRREWKDPWGWLGPRKVLDGSTAGCEPCVFLTGLV